MIYYKLNKEKDINLIYFFSVFLVFIFFKDYITNDGVQIYVKYLNINSIYLFIIISLLFLTITCFRKIIVNKLSTLLIISIMLGLVPILYNTNLSTYWGNYLSVIMSTIAFLICSNSKEEFTQKVYKILCFVSLVISLQVIYTEYVNFGILSLSNISNTSIKLFMKIPIGSSNLIAAFLLPILIFICSYNKSKIRIPICLLNIYALVLCRSKNALSLLCIIAFYLIVKKIYLFIIKDKSVSKLTKLIIISFITVILAGGALLLFKIISNIVFSLRFDYYISPLPNGVLNKIDTLSSGRIVVYLDELSRFKEHIIFGNGFNYELGMKRSHNWIIDLLVQRGLVGLLIYLICLYDVFKISLKNNDKFIKASGNLLLIIFIQGLFEVSVFTLGIDFLIWSMAGFIFARHRYLKTVIDNYCEVTL